MSYCLIQHEGHGKVSFTNKWQSRKQYKIETQLQWITNRMSFVLHQMAPLSMTLLDLEGHFSYYKHFLNPMSLKIAYVYQRIESCMLATNSTVTIEFIGSHVR